METYINRFGEKVTKWKSHVHPDRPGEWQADPINWVIYHRPEGDTRKPLIGYALDNQSSYKWVWGITPEEALERFTDKLITDSEMMEKLWEERQNKLSY